ncbi:MAG: MotA/TolQ/ExbB proton channel family protein [Oscillospiraceae bacterium]|nr:MotA/TolQ/ExbB proton channel family protein [Oscillospiraceae bacterium]
MASSLQNVLQVVADALLYPDIIALLLFMLLAVWQIGDFVAELFTERRKLKADVPDLLTQISGRGKTEVIETMDSSGLLARHKRVLHRIFDPEHQSRTARLALAERVLASEEKYYSKSTVVTDLVAKLGPMAGLLGTLIPLGPGIIALSNGDTATLADSLGVAFNTTIAGVASSSVCYVISHIRKRWYSDYMVTLETLTESIMEEVCLNEK